MGNSIAKALKERRNLSLANKRNHLALWIKYTWWAKHSILRYLKLYTAPRGHTTAQQSCGVNQKNQIGWQFFIPRTAVKCWQANLCEPHYVTSPTIKLIADNMEQSVAMEKPVWSEFVHVQIIFVIIF